MIFLIKLCTEYSEDDQHAILEYLKVLNSDWGAGTMQDFDQKLKQLHAQREVLQMRGILKP